MEIDFSQFRETFFEEAFEHVATLEATLLVLESAPADRDLLNLLFRAAHSMKGSSAMLELVDITAFTHVLETLLDRVRSGALPWNPELSGLLFQSVDALRALVDCGESGRTPPPCAVLKSQLAALAGVSRPALPEPTRAIRSPGLRVRHGVTFRPAAATFADGHDPTLWLRDLCALGTVGAIAVAIGELPLLAALDPERSYLGWSLELDTERSVADVQEVFAFVSGHCQLAITRLDACDDEPAPEVLLAAQTPTETQTQTQARNETRTETRLLAHEAASIRVATEKVDALVNLVGELVIAQSMVDCALKRVAHDSALCEAVAQMERCTRALQERVMAVRMLPVGTVFARFPRMVRDLSAQLGKQVTLEVGGEEIELDKGVIEQVADPLTHLIRNALDHGLEDPEARELAGKSRVGTLRLSASQQNGSVVIEVGDDGRGLSRQSIFARAVELGLYAADDVLTDEQLFALIFVPGFSTRSTANEVSGRGVGMDVVKRNIAALNGFVRVSSEPGRGTTCQLRIPLTLAVLDGLSLKLGEQLFIVPLSAVVESLRPQRSQHKRLLGGGELVMVREEAVPLLRLGTLLGVRSRAKDPTEGLVVLVETAGRKVALLVDELVGQSQVVIKSIESNFRRVAGVMGATIMGDGQLALILDVAALTTLGPRERAPVGTETLQSPGGG